MAVVPISILKTYFNTGDTPTEAQYVNLIDTLAALPASASIKWINLANDGMTVKATFFGSGSPTIAKDAAGEYTIAFPAGLTPMGLVITGDADNLTGGGQITLHIDNSDSLLVHSTRTWRRADTYAVISDPKGEMTIGETETVTAGSCDQVFTNLNNFPSEGWVLVQSLVAYSTTDNAA